MPTHEAIRILRRNSLKIILCKLVGCTFSAEDNATDVDPHQKFEMNVLILKYLY